MARSRDDARREVIGEVGRIVNLVATELDRLELSPTDEWDLYEALSYANCHTRLASPNLTSMRIALVAARSIVASAGNQTTAATMVAALSETLRQIDCAEAIP